jgi:hypothetical protein
VEQVEVALECSVKDDVTRAHPMPTGVAGFLISSGKNDGGERLAVAMPWELLGGRVPHPPGRGASERGV